MLLLEWKISLCTQRVCVFLSDNTHPWGATKSTAGTAQEWFQCRWSPTAEKYKSCSTTHQTCLNLIRNAFNLLLGRELLEISYSQTRSSLPLFISTEFQEQSACEQVEMGQGDWNITPHKNISDLKGKEHKMNFHLQLIEQTSSFYLDKPLHSNTSFLSPLCTIIIQPDNCWDTCKTPDKIHEYFIEVGDHSWCFLPRNFDIPLWKMQVSAWSEPMGNNLFGCHSARQHSSSILVCLLHV